jgi:predicted nucleic acid-binding protein
MKRVFIDTDVILDFLIKREPFSIEAMKLFDYASKGKLKIYASSLTFNNIHYVVSRLENANKSKQKLMVLFNLTEILPVGKSTIRKSLYSDFKDFEDGIQNFCAEENRVETIITRNIKDYSTSNLLVQNPKEFIAGFEIR